MLDGTLLHNGRRFAVCSFPIGVHIETFQTLADASDGATKLGPHDHADLVIGVDRLDYTKGLVNRFEAFGIYLDSHATILIAMRPQPHALHCLNSRRLAV